MCFFHLQSFLSEDEHHKVNKVSWYDVEEENTYLVNQFVIPDVAIWIPNCSFEWIFSAQISSCFQNLTPVHHLLLVHVCYIENWNVCGSKGN